MTSQFEAFLSDAETKAKQKEEEEAKLLAEKEAEKAKRAAEKLNPPAPQPKPKKEPKPRDIIDTQKARAGRVGKYVEAVYSMDKTDGNTDAPKRTPGSVLKMLVMEPDFGCVGPAFSSVTRELAMLSDDQMERIAHAIAHAYRIAYRCYGTAEKE